MAESVFFYTIGSGTMGIDFYFRAKMIYHVGRTKLKVEGTTGLGKKWIEGKGEYDESVVHERYTGFTGGFEKNKIFAEKYWNEFHRQKVRIDSLKNNEIQKEIEPYTN